jgi:hypothetical protein
LTDAEWEQLAPYRPQATTTKAACDAFILARKRRRVQRAALREIDEHLGSLLRVPLQVANLPDVQPLPRSHRLLPQASAHAAPQSCCPKYILKVV